VGELVLTGVEAIDSSSSSQTCTPKLVVDGTELTLPATVTYQGSSTPKLESIEPRYGSVEGNTLVTFTGTGFSTLMADVAIIIDEVECDV